MKVYRHRYISNHEISKNLLVFCLYHFELFQAHVSLMPLVSPSLAREHQIHASAVQGLGRLPLYEVRDE